MPILQVNNLNKTYTARGKSSQGVDETTYLTFTPKYYTLEYNTLEYNVWNSLTVKQS